MNTMVITRNLIVLMSLVGSLGTAHAANWIQLPRDDEVSVAVDVESIRKYDRHITVWTSWIFARPQSIPIGPLPEFYQSTKQQVAILCVERRIAMVLTIYYRDADQRRVITTVVSPDGRREYTEPAPETIGDTVVGLACAW